MKKLYLLPLILLACCYSFSAQGEKLSTDNIANNPQESFYYINQLEKHYPLLWKHENKELDKFDIAEKTKEYNAIYLFKINEIKPDGYIVKLASLAKQDGIFTLLEKAYQAPLKTIADIGNYDKSPVEFKQKLASSLLQLKYIYYYKILKQSEEGKWEEVVKDLTIWANAFLVINNNKTFTKSISRLIIHLIENYKIPDKEKEAILKLEKHVNA
jgi:hypothetical protein